MRHYIKSLLVSIAAFYITYTLIPTIAIGNDPKNYLLVLGGIWVISQVVSPIFSLVLLPVNLLTFGLVSLLLNVAFVFALLNFLPGFLVSAYTFPGGNIAGVILPAVPLNEIESIILVAVCITFLQKILHVIFE